MMNEIIKKQLNLVRIAKLPLYDDNTTKMIIPKTLSIEETVIDIGHYYVIELADYIVNPPPNFNLHVNWNNNNIPKYKYFRCEVIAAIGKMIKINGVACDMKTLGDLDYTWVGWVPKKSISIIKELS